MPPAPAATTPRSGVRPPDPRLTPHTARDAEASSTGHRTLGGEARQPDEPARVRAGR
jgi:hypothetical protein